MGRVDPEGLQQPAARHVHLPLPLSATRSGRVERAHQGHLRDTRAVRIQARSCHAEAGGMVREPEESSTALQRIGPAVTEQAPKTEGQGQAHSRSQGGGISA